MKLFLLVTLALLASAPFLAARAESGYTCRIDFEREEYGSIHVAGSHKYESRAFQLASTACARILFAKGEPWNRCANVYNRGCREDLSNSRAYYQCGLMAPKCAFGELPAANNQ